LCGVRPEDYEYALPAGAIAQQPAKRRGDARMLVVHEGSRVHARARQLSEYLLPGALVVLNDSKVVPARIEARRDDGRCFELLVCGPRAGLGPGETVRAWVRGARRLCTGDLLRAGGLVLRLEGPDSVDPRARVFAVVGGDVLACLHEHGQVPLPPYVERPQGPMPEDSERYQTVYAALEGSVAAPTAGLHFEADLLAGLDHVALTLHVGPGTFLPMEVADVSQHRVGEERVVVGDEAAQRIQAARQEGRPVVAVGTTVTRALEAVAAGASGEIVPFSGTTDLVIGPGYPFSVVDQLLTNFHLPRTSLLMLVCSFAGRDPVMAAYEEAIAEGYRFYSYGDCMLISRATT
jgi:S-adenosylmethionine:tRNA ribosyltransferase-isomerase